ncbi:hypothetical protein [Flavobacterium crassostreae]|uniref:Tetratricopeptide repeat protein n=1 Tax=Flavobacterium crassostreae TaxID=1763534 RepID=A0A1B9E9N5_9FLAO|nr:hypothetical protein [Flavobacterium crassostreae]OCB78667.1 hypothetical protein LPBF_01350 [Flavobacterium crassostreae]
MKNKILILVLFFISIKAVSQKEQIKNAQNEFKSDNLKVALDILTKSEYLIINAEDADKSEFYSLKAEIFRAFADKNIAVTTNLSAAVTSYQQLIKEELLTGNLIYIVKAREAIDAIKKDLENRATTDIKNAKYRDGATKMYALYAMDKKDADNLYYSTSYFMMAKDYEAALRNYKELENINYTGKGVAYYAVNKKTKIEEEFASAMYRDASVNAGEYEKPRNAKIESKRTEICRNLAYLYTEKGDLVAAEVIYKKMIAFNPNFIEPYLDLAYLNLDKKKLLEDQMNTLGTSAKEMQIYDALKLKTEGFIKEALFYLKAGNALAPDNDKITDLLLKLYRALDLTSEYNTLKAKI